MIFRATLCVCLASVVMAGVARAETESVRLEYRAPDECPSAQEFRAEVRARTSKVTFADDGRRFDVTVEYDSSGFEGRLTITELDGRENQRTLDGSQCVDVVSSLALVAALAIDPEASTAPRAELEPAKPMEETPAASTPSPVEPERALPPPLPPPLRRSQPVQRPLRVAVGAAFALVQSPAPVLLVGAGAEAEVTSSFGWNHPRVRLGFLAAQTGIVGAEDEQSEFRWLVARPALCPLGHDGSFRVSVCALADLGVVRAEGRSVDVPQSASRFWAALGPAGRVGLATRRFYVDLELAWLVPLTRDDFVFENPRRVVHDVPAFGWSGGVSLGVKIP